MTLSNNLKLRGNPLNSLFFKCTFVVAVCVLLVVATLEVFEVQTKTAMTRTALSKRAIEVSELLAMQMGGAIKFGNAAAIDEIVGGVIATAAPDATGALVLDADGTVLHREMLEGFDGAQAEDLARRALSEADAVLSLDGMTVAMPSFFGSTIPAGVVVTSWSDQTQMAALGQIKRRALLTALVMMVAALVMAAVFLHRYMSRPLIRIEAAMGEIAQENYAVTVPYTARGDEIGQMARRLSIFRDTLAAAKVTARESAFKSAAFGGSAAPMMMVDERFEVIFVNPACQTLIAGLLPDLAEHWQGLALDRLVGAKLQEFDVMTPLVARIRVEGDEALPLAVDLTLGEARIQVKLNAAQDEAGQMIGAVLEWTDRTEAARNAALLSTINMHQLRLEFDASGVLRDANDNFVALVGTAQGALLGRRFDTLFGAEHGGGHDAQAVCATVLSGTPLHGRFELMPDAGGAPLFVEGSFTSVLGADGMAERCIFLGSDVTASDRDMRRAEAERAVLGDETEKALRVHRIDGREELLEINSGCCRAHCCAA